MENGTWNFLEPRKKNISDLSEGMDHLMLLSISVAKIFLYFNIYKHISKTFNLASLKDNERRNKFKKVYILYLITQFVTFSYTFVKASFMTLWANILEVITETTLVFFFLIFYGNSKQ